MTAIFPGLDNRLNRYPGYRYQRHQPEGTDLYRVISTNWPGFEAELARANITLPSFVRDEFASYLKCGLLENGFLRFKCQHCRFEHLVAFSCKLRGFCPSCGTRRMIETAAHLVDNVLPEVPVRQWVLSFPYPLRFLFARDPDSLGRCLKVIFRAIEAQLMKQAGLKRRSGARTGMVTLIQRFGSALNLNIHLHMLVLDGLYTVDGNQVVFHRALPVRPADLEVLLTRIIRRVVRRLEKDGLLIPDDQQPLLDLIDTGPLDHLQAASIRYRIAIGPQSGRRTMTLHNPALIRPGKPDKPLTADQSGFSLNAAVVCQPHQRDRLERLCRYVCRPAIALDRLVLRGDGQVQYALKRAFRDGTTHVLFSPRDFISRLVALIPRPRRHLVRYHGVLAPNASLRAAIVPGESRQKKRRGHAPEREEKPSQLTPADLPTAPLTWAQRLKRVFAIDVLTCPRCGGRLRLIADVTEPTVIQKILDHVARSPPSLRGD